jgi:hypothetical protein
VEAGTDIQHKGKKTILDGTVAEKFTNEWKEMHIHIHEVFRISKTHDKKRSSPCQILVKMPRIQNKERILKTARKKCQVTHKRK